jgi:ubiquinone/menaquinone biosynthesis C-methylase UbiE
MGSIMWGRDLAEVYDATYSAKFDASALAPVVDLLAELAKGGPALEFAVGTGRVALPLQARGVAVHGIELSPHMVDQLRAKPAGDVVPVTVGDMKQIQKATQSIMDGDALASSGDFGEAAKNYHEAFQKL